MNHRRNNRPSVGSGTLWAGSVLLWAGSLYFDKLSNRTVEVSCIYLTNRGPFDVALRQAQGPLRDPMTLRLEATLPFQGSYNSAAAIPKQDR